MSAPVVLSPVMVGAVGPGRGRRAVRVAACLLLVAVIAVSDYLTGYELNLSILYLATVCLATWIMGRAAGLAIALAAIVAWLVTDIMSGHVYSHPLYRYWEGTIRIGTWIGFALLLDSLKTARARADERVMTILAQLDAAVYVADSSSDVLLYRNARCEHAFGRSAATAREISARWTAAGLPDRDMKNAAVQAEVFDAPSGRWYLVAAHTIRWIDGRPVTLHIAADVTDRHRAEAIARRQQERLETTARLTTLGEMASTLAHEVSQPLAAIANYCNGCVRLLRGGDWQRDQLLDAMDKAAQQAERAGGIIRRIREYPRKRDPDPQPCDINGIILTVVHMIQADTERRGARLHVEPAAVLPPVLADRIMIEQVLLNLIRNAVDAMETMPAAEREVLIVSLAAEDHCVAVEVADRGCGLPRELAETLFIPCFTTKPDGMGMGLHICRSIVERHGGRLTAAPRPGGGTVFRFTLRATA